MSTIIGLTGGIASGKSTISDMLKNRGITVIDADIEARLAVEPGMNDTTKLLTTLERKSCYMMEQLTAQNLEKLFLITITSAPF